MMTKARDEIDLLSLTRYFIEEFPLLEELGFAQSSKAQPSRIPSYYAYFLATAFSPDKRPCCFILPVNDETPLIAACLIAFYDVKHRFEEFLKRYAQTALTAGELVRVLPSKDVYVYGGIADPQSSSFWLLEQNSKNSARRSKALKEIVRLEPTNRKTPKGKLDRDPFKPALSSMDLLLDLETYSNTSVFLNTAIVAAAKKTFQGFLDGAYFYGKNIKKADALGSYLPWATVQADGSFRPNDPYRRFGEPVIAVSPKSFNIGERCRLEQEYSKVVIVADLERLTQNLSAFDDLVDRQKVLMFASRSQVAEFPVLVQKNVLIWELTYDEIFIGEQDVDERMTKQFSLLQAASDAKTRTVDLSVVIDNSFTDCAVLLEELKTCLKAQTEVLEQANLVLQQLYFGLLDLSSLLVPPGTEAVEGLFKKLDLCLEQTNSLRMYIKPEIFDLFNTCILAVRALVQRISTEEFLKSDPLRELISKMADKNELVIVSRNRLSRRNALDFSLKNRLQLNVKEAVEIKGKKSYSTMIVTGWPGSRQWNQLIHSGSCRRVILLCYDFEARWFKSFERNNEYHRQQNSLSAKDKASLLAIPSELVITADVVQNEVLTPSVEEEFSFAIERRFQHVRKDLLSAIKADTDDSELKEAHYVSFVGESYAYLGPSHKIPVITDVLESGASKSFRDSKPLDLKIGDMVLFRETGEGSVLKDIAERRIGVQAYAEVRQRAGAWRVPLRKLGGNPRNVAKFLASKGLDRNWLTISNWLYDPDLIGPENVKDIEAIGLITGDLDVQKNAEEIMGEIQEIRKQHVLAGHALSDMILAAIPATLNDLADAETELTLDIGTVWIVTVDYIEKRSERYPPQYLNSIRWN